MMISETIPMTIMLMPAAQGALSRSFETYAAYLGDMGWAVPGNLPAALALTTTAAVAGLAKLLEHGISPEEYNVRALASISDVSYCMPLFAEGDCTLLNSLNNICLHMDCSATRQHFVLCNGVHSEEARLTRMHPVPCTSSLA